jgi:hypothetical protein
MLELHIVFWLSTIWSFSVMIVHTPCEKLHFPISELCILLRHHYCCVNMLGTMLYSTEQGPCTYNLCRILFLQYLFRILFLSSPILRQYHANWIIWHWDSVICMDVCPHLAVVIFTSQQMSIKHICTFIHSYIICVILGLWLQYYIIFSEGFGMDRS